MSDKRKIGKKLKRRTLWGSIAMACSYCGRSVKPSKLVAEHAVPLCRGGRDVSSNIRGACRECDKLKGPLTAEEYLAVRHDHAARKQLIRAVFADMRATAPSS